MPKTKTHSGATKRFKATKTGKLLRKTSGMRHNLGKKTTKQKRHLRPSVLVHPADQPRMNVLLSKKKLPKPSYHA